MIETLPAMSPPNNNGKDVSLSFPDDEIRDLGDRIANLTIKEAVKLSAYLATMGVK
jgi:hypothetical protein